MSPVIARPPSAATVVTPAEQRPVRILWYPSGFTARFAGLVLVTVLSSSFVGDWFYLSVRATGDSLLPSAWWLTVPPALVLVAALALTVVMPRWLEWRRGLAPVPPDIGRAALDRFGHLSDQEGLSRSPDLMWNSSEPGANALAYGSPGAYRVAVTPSLVAAARRRPETFDAVMRHELAHLRNRDVLPAYFTLSVWYALVPVLAAPILWRVVDHDLGLVPDYLVRVLVLAALVYAIRTDVLRSREHYADVGAATTPDDARDLRAVLTAGRTPKGLLTLHPSPGARVRILESPDLLARLRPMEFFGVGLAAAWSLPLLEELVAHSDLASAFRAAQVSRWILFGLTGAYVGVVLARWAGVDACGDVVLAAGALVVGLALGSSMAIAKTGLFLQARADVAGAAITALLCGVAVIWAGDLARVITGRASSRRGVRVGAGLCAVLAAGLFAVLADAALVVSELVRLGQHSFLDMNVVYGMGGRSATVAAGAGLVCAGIVVPGWLRAKGREAQILSSAVRSAVLAFAVGATSGIVLVVGRMRVRNGAEVLDAQHYYSAMVWTTAVASLMVGVAHVLRPRIGRMLTAAPAVACAIVGSAVSFAIVSNVAFDTTFGASDVRKISRDTAALVILLVPAAFVVGAVVSPAFARWFRDRRTVNRLLGVTVVAAAACVSVVVLPAAVSAPADQQASARPELSYFLTHQVNMVLHERDAAIRQLSLVPQNNPNAPALIRLVLTGYDDALYMVEVTKVTDPEAVRVQAVLIRWLKAERTSVATLADTLDGRHPESVYADARAAATTALQSWQQVYVEATRLVGLQ